VEEQFYLLWPFVVLLAAGPRLPWVCLALVLFALLSRVLLLQAGAKPEMLYMFTHCRMDALAMGAGAAALALRPAWTKWLVDNFRAVLLTLFAALCAAALFSHTYSVYDSRTLILGQTLLAGAFALLIAGIGSIPRGRFGHILRRLFEMRWLRAVGRYSFAMYVLHIPILLTFGDAIRDALAFSGSATPLLYALTAIALSFLAGLISYHLLEKHFLRLKSVLA
jgi:peptidoglycan/LPS O-acetylase OafA/YrhL